MASTISAGTTAGTAIVVSGDTSGSLQLQTNGTTTAVTINTSQNVGIGTSSPSSKLTVGGNPPVAGAIAGVGASGGISLALSDNVNNSLYVKHVASGVATFGTDAGGQIAFATNGFTEQMRIDSAGLLKFNSGYGSVATAYGCRAWVNFNGTGTVAIRASGNVSSITDNSVGNYTVNFTTAMPDANYAITDGIGATVGDYGSDIIFFTFTTSAVSFAVVNRTPAYTDFSTLCISVFR